MPKIEQLTGNVASINNPEFIPGATNADGTPRVNPFFSLMPSAPIWYRNMPARFPFGETPFTAKVMSDQINYDLKNTHETDEMPRPPGRINYAAGLRGPRKTHVFNTPWELPPIDEKLLDQLLEAEEAEEVSRSPVTGNKRPAPHEEAEEGGEHEGPPSKR